MIDRTSPLGQALLQKGVPEKPPLWELEFHPWNAFSERKLIRGEDFHSLSAAEAEAALHTNAEIILEVSRQLGFSALTTPAGFWQQAPGELAYYTVPPELCDLQIRILRELDPHIPLFSHCGATIGAGFIFNPETCELLFEDPDAVDEIAKNIVTKAGARARKLRDLGVDAVFSPADIADNSGPYFRPAQMERWIYPQLAQWSETVHDLGMAAIMHSDGDLTAYLPRLAETGIDALQAIDPIAGMKMITAMEAVDGKICLAGNIDCGLLFDGPPAKIAEAARELLATCAPKAPMLFGASNAVQKEVPKEHYLAMIQALREWSS